jgi:hypothetical protein
MTKGAKRGLVCTIVAIIGLAVLVGIRLYKDPFMAGLFSYDPYKYHYFCSEMGEKCLTVVTYSKPSIGDNPFKRYVVFGKNNYTLPITQNYIEFPEDTGVVVIWESDMMCRIISNAPPVKSMKLSDDVNIEIVYSNRLYEKYAKEFPKFAL